MVPSPLTKTPVYDSSQRGSWAVQELYEVVRYRNLILQLVRRDVTSRYKRSVLGVAWTMLNPLGTMLVLSIAFSQILGTTPGYPAFVLNGLIGWVFFAQTTTASIVNLVWGGSLLNRIYIPRTSFAISAVGTSLVNIALSLIPMFFVMLFAGVPIKWTVIYLPIPILILSLFSLGVGLLISAVAVFFPDVAEMYQIMLSAWMYLTPIIYPPEMLPEGTLWWIEQLNPMYWIIKLLRLPLYDGLPITWTDLQPALLWTVGVLIVGWLFFSKKADQFAYRV